jgi:hypothetical protein
MPGSLCGRELPEGWEGAKRAKLSFRVPISGRSGLVLALVLGSRQRIKGRHEHRKLIAGQRVVVQGVFEVTPEIALHAVTPGGWPVLARSALNRAIRCSASPRRSGAGTFEREISMISRNTSWAMMLAIDSPSRRQQRPIFPATRIATGQRTTALERTGQSAAAFGPPGGPLQEGEAQECGCRKSKR